MSFNITENQFFSVRYVDLQVRFVADLKCYNSFGVKC